MKTLKNKSSILIVLFLTIASLSFGQNAKKHYNVGMDFMEVENYLAASESFTRVIDLDPAYAKAYLQRGIAFENLGKYKEALEDFNKASTFLTKDPDVFASIGKTYYLMGELETGLENAEKAISLRKGYVKSYYVKYDILMAQEKFTEAMEAADIAIALLPDEHNYYRKGKALEMAGKLYEAERAYERALSKRKKFIKGYVALANLQIQTKDLEMAMFNAEMALRFDFNDRNAHLVKSRIFAQQKEYSNAINEISVILADNPEDLELYIVRGEYYQSFTQHGSAISDFSRVIMLDNNNVEAYFKRAHSYEQTAELKKAIKDYEKVAELSDESDIKAQLLLKKTAKRMFELNKEENKPEIAVTNPVEKQGHTINLPTNASEAIIKIFVKDESEILSVKVNNKEVPFLKKEDGIEIDTKLEIAGKELFTITATDAYNNTQHSTYTIKYTETDAPKVAIIAPFASDDGEIMLDNFEPTIYVEGRINDESKIKSISIEDVSASYASGQLNPSFNATISIANKSQITVVVEDIYGNKKEQIFTLNRASAEELENNPMGKTWVIFIENSNYANFASLEGPQKDVTLMRSALAKYKINKVIHKKDMNKTEMSRFFAIELRDLVRSNKVTSLMVWYAGHGKFVSETGYWIPVDANRDDEFTYFNISSLRSSLQAYSKYVTHTLVITDACESGPTFYQAMRAIPKEKTCDDWQAVKFKSSQVFSSAGYELAVDNSQFTKTFARTLASNPNACIPIEKIVKTVSNAVASNNQQKPKFGKIAGMEDENGTFFFISK